MLRGSGTKRTVQLPKRQLVRWNDDLNNQLLLCIQSASNHRGVKIPWDAVGQFMNDPRTGRPLTEGAVVQHLAKLRLHLIETGAPVPPPLKRGGKHLNTNGGSTTANANAAAVRAAPASVAALPTAMPKTRAKVQAVVVGGSGLTDFASTNVGKANNKQTSNDSDSDDPDDGDSSGEFGKSCVSRTKLSKRGKVKAKRPIVKGEACIDEEDDTEDSAPAADTGMKRKYEGQEEYDNELDAEGVSDDASIHATEAGDFATTYGQSAAAGGSYAGSSDVGSSHTGSSASDVGNGSTYGHAGTSNIGNGPYYVGAGASYLPEGAAAPTAAVTYAPRPQSLEKKSLVVILDWGKAFSPHPASYLRAFKKLQNCGVIPSGIRPRSPSLSATNSVTSTTPRSLVAHRRSPRTSPRYRAPNGTGEAKNQPSAHRTKSSNHKKYGRHGDGKKPPGVGKSKMRYEPYPQPVHQPIHSNMDLVERAPSSSGRQPRLDPNLPAATYDGSTVIHQFNQGTMGGVPIFDFSNTADYNGPVMVPNIPFPPGFENFLNDNGQGTSMPNNSIPRGSNVLPNPHLHHFQMNPKAEDIANTQQIDNSGYYNQPISHPNGVQHYLGRNTVYEDDAIGAATMRSHTGLVDGAEGDMMLCDESFFEDDVNFT